MTGPGPGRSAVAGLGTIPPPLAAPSRSGGRAKAAGPHPALGHLAGRSAAPGLLGRIGPITPSRPDSSPTPPEPTRRPVAHHRHQPAGQAIAVTRIPPQPRRPRSGPRQSWPGPRRPWPARDGSGPAVTAPRRPRRPDADRGSAPGAGLVGRVTLTITQDTLTSHQQAADPRPPAGTARPGPPARQPGPDHPPGQPDPDHPPGSQTRTTADITAMALHAAARALHTALAQARADAAAGGCAHHARSDAYRPPPRLREQVTARTSPAATRPAASLPGAPTSTTPAPGKTAADLPLQPRRCLPPRPPAQAAPPLEPGQTRPATSPGPP